MALLSRDLIDEILQVADAYSAEMKGLIQKKASADTDGPRAHAAAPAGKRAAPKRPVNRNG